jgi:glycolate oxidase FAD binding subunit
LLKAPAAVRAAEPVFQPRPAAVAAVAARLRDAFDPRGILNPGRMS